MLILQSKYIQAFRRGYKLKNITRPLIIALIALMFFTVIFIAPYGALADNSTATPTPDVSPTPTPTPQPTPRTVFPNNPRWETDHIVITVNNNGPAISVTAYIEDAYNSIIYNVPANKTNYKISTPSISVQDGEIVRYGFLAYENGILVDRKESSLVVTIGATPTPMPPESATVSGVILDKTTGQPLAYAQVIFTSKTYDHQYPAITTGTDGSFRTGKMYPDYYSIQVVATGYQTISIANTTEVIQGDVTLQTIQLERLPSFTPTPTPTPTATPTVNVLDNWINVLGTPTLCVGTLSSMVAVLVSLTVIYEWLERRREKRRKADEKAEQDKKDLNK